MRRYNWELVEARLIQFVIQCDHRRGHNFEGRNIRKRVCDMRIIYKTIPNSIAFSVSRQQSPVGRETLRARYTILVDHLSSNAAPEQYNGNY